MGQAQELSVPQGQFWGVGTDNAQARARRDGTDGTDKSPDEGGDNKVWLRGTIWLATCVLSANDLRPPRTWSFIGPMVGSFAGSVIMPDTRLTQRINMGCLIHGVFIVLHIVALMLGFFGLIITIPLRIIVYLLMKKNEDTS